MNRVEDMNEVELVELGSVTDETKGPIAPRGDNVGLSFGTGLSDD